MASKKPQSARSVQHVDPVRDYLARAGLTITSSEETYWRRVERQHGEQYARKLDAELSRRRAGLGATGAYSLLYQDLDVAQVNASLASPWLPKWLRTWAKLTLPPGDVIDLGCGAGFATCFYATLRPNSRVVGIEQLPVAVERARELARTLELENVEFRQGDVFSPDPTLGRFSVVVSTAVLHEAEQNAIFRTNAFSTVRELPRLLEGIRRSAFATAASDLVGEGGRYVSFERHPFAESAANWMGALGLSGLGIDLEQSNEVSFEFFGGWERFPFVVAGIGLRTPTAEEFIEWQRKLNRSRRSDNDGFDEELRLQLMQPLKVMMGWEATYQGELPAPRHRMLVLEDEKGAGILYESSTLGYRHIAQIVPQRKLGGLVAEARLKVESLDQSPEVAFVKALDADESLRTLPPQT